MGFRGVAKPPELYKIILSVCVYVCFSLKKVKNFNYYSIILFLSFFKFYFIFKLYIIVLVLPNIKMNQPQVYMCSGKSTKMC